MSFYDQGYRAMAKILGVHHRRLFELALMYWADDAEQRLGFGVVAAADLTPDQIKELTQKVRMASNAAFITGGTARFN